MVASLSNSPKSQNSIKLLCSYGGKILPRRPDGKLRYIGGETRVLAVDRSISFQDLIIKLGELHGSPVTLRCQLPEEDLDALVTITCDEDFLNLVEEYDLASQMTGSQLKVRVFLWPLKPIKKVRSPSTSPVKQFDARKQYLGGFVAATPVRPRLCYSNGAPRVQGQASFRHLRPVHNGNYWQ